MEDPDLGYEVGLGACDTGASATSFGAIERETADAELGDDGLSEPRTCGTADHGLGHAPGVRTGSGEATSEAIPSVRGPG